MVLASLVQPGGGVLDIGVNVGNYTGRLSGLVGLARRGIVRDPVTDTFAVLSTNAQRLDAA